MTLSSAAAIRTRVQFLREGFSEARLKEKSDSSLQKLLDQQGEWLLNWFGKNRNPTVALFKPTAEEFSLSLFENFLNQISISIAYPRVEDRKECRMEFYTGGTFRSGDFGIDEPAPDSIWVDPKSIDLMIVPGTVFGLKGERLGRGKGYYDRFLPRANKAIRLAFCFEHQMVEDLIQEPWDQKMDWIWSENFEYRSFRLGQYLKTE